MLLWQRMAPPHNGRTITCDLCGAGPSLGKDFFSIPANVRLCAGEEVSPEQRPRLGRPELWEKFYECRTRLRGATAGVDAYPGSLGCPCRHRLLHPGFWSD